MSHTILRPFIIKVSVLGYFPLLSNALDIIVGIKKTIFESQ